MNTVRHITTTTRNAIESKLVKVLMKLNGQEGASAVEYALIAGLIAAVIITALTDTGTSVRTLFETVADSMPGAGGSE